MLYKYSILSAGTILCTTGYFEALVCAFFFTFLSDKEVQASQEINRVENNEDTFANIIIEVLR